MKVLMLNGSAKKKGCTYTALSVIADALQKEGIESEIVCIGGNPVRDCIGCGACSKLDCRCTFDDDIVNELLQKAEEADGFVFGTPVYFAHPSGRILSVLDRMFYAGKSVMAGKPGAAIASARRAGTTASIDVLNKYFNFNQMPIVSAQYWNMVHGNRPEDVLQDKEGIQIMETIGANMAYMLRSLEAAREAGVEAPQPKDKVMTNFIR